MNRRMFGWFAAGALAVGLGFVASPAAAATKTERPLYKPGEVIVKFTRGTATERMASTAAGADTRATVGRTLADVGWPHVAVVRFPADVSVESMVEKFKAMPGVVYAEPNYYAYIPDLISGRPTVASTPVRARDKSGRPVAATSPIARALATPLINPNDPKAGAQDGWNWIGGNLIWPDAAANPTVAVIDTGADYMHPDLAGQVTKGTDFVNGDTDPMDDNGHGTHVTGIIAAKINNKTGITGMSKAKVLAIKALDAEGGGTYADIAAAVLLAANNTSVKVISMSLGGAGNSQTLLDAVTTAVVTKGKLLVAAAGNNGDTNFNYPAAYADGVDHGDGIFNAALFGKMLAVAADGLLEDTTNGQGVFISDYQCKASYSTYGDWVSVSAPGTWIYSTTPHNRSFWLGQHYPPGCVANDPSNPCVSGDYDYLSGTSMATPMVAGTAARVFGVSPGATNADVFNKIVTTGFETVSLQGVQVDTNGNGTPDTDCWPAANNAAMTDAYAPNAMSRGVAVGGVANANTGTGLQGAQILAYQGSAKKGYGGVVESFNDPSAAIIDLPYAVTPYDFKASKSGFTAGTQKFDSQVVDSSNSVVGLQTVSVPQSVAGRYYFVTDWDFVDANNDGLDDNEIDQYLYLPSSAAPHGAVGYYGFFGTGSLTALPFARVLHDGGYYSASAPLETIAAKGPLLSTATGTPYQIFLNDYFDNGAPGSQRATTRIWYGGAIKGTVHADAHDSSACTYNGGAVDCNGFYVGDLTSSGVFTEVGTYGDACFFNPAGCPGGILPYGMEGRIGRNRTTKAPAPHSGHRVKQTQ